ncbi:MAG: response regulator, partial [Firmicutes bacterium]|nr:response regulator [Bacillota bacterium]
MPLTAEKPYILHVDDDKDFQSLFYYTFNSSFKIEMVQDAREALAAASEKNFDAIVTDYEMPKMNGIELLNELKK